ncbi:hypothetical protein, partial [Rhizobium leguminosarum]|uniref:hypothetical protein n=1 Tax=Rhizobium leguminosarum TaxID=384 RepID=UPI001C9278A6
VRRSYCCRVVSVQAIVFSIESSQIPTESQLAEITQLFLGQSLRKKMPDLPGVTGPIQNHKPSKGSQSQRLGCSRLKT